MAFSAVESKGLGAEKEDIEAVSTHNDNKASTTRDVDEIDEADEDVFGESGDEEESPKEQTLLEIAKHEAASATPSLMEIAKSLEVESVQQSSC